MSGSTQRELDDLLKYLKRNYPLPRTHKLLVAYRDAASITDDNLTRAFPVLNEVPGAYYPNPRRTRKIPYTGLLLVALRCESPLNVLCHEYRHAMQHAEGTAVESSRWENEVDSITFARMVVAEYSAEHGCANAKSKSRSLKKAA